MHVVDALAITGDEGRGSLRKASGSWQTSIDPKILVFPTLRRVVLRVIGSSEQVHVVDALATTGDEGRCSLR